MAATKNTNGVHLTADEVQFRLAKRLCYILRYGAVKSGLQVTENGFVDFQELVKLPMLRWHTTLDVLHELKSSTSVKNVKRFEVLEQTNNILVRATYARNFEKKSNIFENEEKDGKVDSLFELSLQHIMDHLEDYDLTEFQDEHIIRTMLYRLKIQKKLNMKLFRILLVPTLEHVDMEDVYLTENILKLMCKNCPNIKELSFKKCGYIITDSLLAQIVRKLPQLQSLNLAFCDHLTDKCFDVLCKHCLNIKELNLNKIKNFTEEAVIKFVISCTSLQKLEIYNVKLSETGRDVVFDLARSRGLKVTYRGMESSDVAPEPPGYL